jgi:hypothetical protein
MNASYVYYFVCPPNTGFLLQSWCIRIQISLVNHRGGLLRIMPVFEIQSTIKIKFPIQDSSSVTELQYTSSIPDIFSWNSGLHTPSSWFWSTSFRKINFLTPRLVADIISQSHRGSPLVEKWTASAGGPLRLAQTHTRLVTPLKAISLWCHAPLQLRQRQRSFRVCAWNSATKSCPWTALWIPSIVFEVLHCI